MQPSWHLHKEVQQRQALLHMQLPLQTTVHPQCNTREHAWFTYGTVQCVTHSLVLAFHVQPQSPGYGISCVLRKTCFQINAAQRSAHFACWGKTCWVGGMESRSLRPLVNICLLASSSDAVPVFAVLEYNHPLHVLHVLGLGVWLQRSQ